MRILGRSRSAATHLFMDPGLLVLLVVVTVFGPALAFTLALGLAKGTLKLAFDTGERLFDTATDAMAPFEFVSPSFVGLHKLTAFDVTLRRI